MRSLLQSSVLKPPEASRCHRTTGVKLMDQLKAEVVEAVAILELQELEGRKKLPNTPLHALAVVSEYGESYWMNKVQGCDILLWSMIATAELPTVWDAMIG